MMINILLASMVLVASPSVSASTEGTPSIPIEKIGCWETPKEFAHQSVAIFRGGTKEFRAPHCFFSTIGEMQTYMAESEREIKKQVPGFKGIFSK